MKALATAATLLLSLHMMGSWAAGDPAAGKALYTT